MNTLLQLFLPFIVCGIKLTATACWKVNLNYIYILHYSSIVTYLILPQNVRNLNTGQVSSLQKKKKLISCKHKLIEQ